MRQRLFGRPPVALLIAPLLGVALLVPGCTRTGVRSGEIASKTTTPAVTAKGEILFGTDLPAALQQARSEKKLVMVDVYTDWCEVCKMLDKDVLSKEDVADAVTKDFIPVRYNPEKAKGGEAFAQRYAIQGYPTILFLDASGKAVHKIEGYAPEDAFLEHLDKARAASPMTAKAS